MVEILVDFGRVITAMVTPFDDDLEVNFEEAGRLAVHLAENGSDTLVVAGTTGESPTLSKEEKLELFKTIVRAVNGRTRVIAGTGNYNTQETIELTRAAEKIGVDGVLLVVPYYNKPTQEGLYRHFAAVAKETSLPIMLYNVPSRTGCNLEAATVARLAEIENIVAVKEASGNMDQVTTIRKNTSPDFAIYSGDDSLTLPILSLGGRGVVSVASHIVGKEMREMIIAYEEGRVKEATEIHVRLFPIFKALFMTTNPIPVKAALGMLGFKTGKLRPPLCELAQHEAEKLQKVLIEQGILK
jgi:4-hydroxy-tetrahydrodipicolinate synthase